MEAVLPRPTKTCHAFVLAYGGIILYACLMQIYEALAIHVAAWRDEGYKHDEFPAIAEILEWASNPDDSNFRLRKPQLRALETYWYLRLLEDTPHIFDLYQSLFHRKKDLLEAFGISDAAFSRADYDVDLLVESIRNNPEFVKEFRFEAVRETLTLDYPSYIFAFGAPPPIVIYDLPSAPSPATPRVR